MKARSSLVKGTVLAIMALVLFLRLISRRLMPALGGRRKMPANVIEDLETFALPVVFREDRLLWES